MKIAIIGWGSLIRDPGEITLASRWRRGGPLLPLEFSRKSRGNRLTLVIDEVEGSQSTFWTLSDCETVEEARDDVREREGTSDSRIHSIDQDGMFYGHKRIDSVVIAVREWMLASDIDATIWTGLEPNWPGDETREFGEWCHDAAVAYLRCLRYHNIHQDAEAYFRLAPPEIETRLRLRVERDLGWAREALPPELVEDI